MLDLVAALVHAGVSDSVYVWLDLFAVRQWPGNVADLDFRPIIRQTKAVLMVARHSQGLAAINPENVRSGVASILGRCAPY